MGTEVLHLRHAGRVSGRSPLYGIARRLRRERRRRSVGRAYDMALEVSRLVPDHSDVLDVGCGNGFIAHHLAGMVSGRVVGIDLPEKVKAPIEYRQFDGEQFPVSDASVDVVLLCYVLHHAQNLGVVLKEVRRVLRAGGQVIVYEDIPRSFWDRFVCWTHDLQWRNRTGRCLFHRAEEWRTLFRSHGFQVMSERPLSRWRNLAHPVSRRIYLLGMDR